MCRYTLSMFRFSGGKRGPKDISPEACWVTPTHMVDLPPIGARSYCSAVRVGNFIYVTGGHGHNKECQRLAIGTWIWSRNERYDI